LHLQTHGEFAETLHDANLYVFGTRLNDLEKTLDRQLDGILSCRIFLVVLLKEFSNGFGRSANSIRLQPAIEREKWVFE
jgi:hypothetical protein